MKAPGRITAWCNVVGLACLTAGVAVVAMLHAPEGPTPAADTVQSASVETTVSQLPPGVLPRAEILARYAGRPGVTVSAKLVSLADLAAASNDELTQCQFRGCKPGALVWLVLEQGPPGSFPHSVPPGYVEPPGADAWMLIPVDATTGRARGDAEIGNVGELGRSVWHRLSDLAPTR